VKAPPRKERCAHCGSRLGKPSYVDHHIVEEIGNPHPRQVIDFLEFTWNCNRCRTYTVSRHPDCPPDGRFGKNLLVQTTLMRFEERLPLRRIEETLQQQYDLTVTPATVLALTRRVDDWLRPEYDRILNRIRHVRVVYVDETGWKVDGQQQWLWVFATPTMTLIVIRRSRGKKVLKETLGPNFQGVIVCDGWKSYVNYTNRIQRCWAHLLREAEYLAERVEEAKPLSEALHNLYRQLTTPPKDRPPPIKESIRLMRTAKRRMLRLATKPYSNPQVRRFAGKIRNGIDHWFTFLTNPYVEPTNNRAERALREHVVQRKIIGTHRNLNGTKTHETIMTLLATWKQQGLNPAKELAETLSKQWQNS
jgi:transposase